MLFIADINSIFTEEITSRGGTIHDHFADDRLFFARSSFPKTSDILPGDKVKGGIAIRASNQDVSVHPYTFRLICRNGMIRAQAIETRAISLADFYDDDQAAESVREAIQCCCAPEVFAASTEVMRESALTPINMLMSLAPMLSHVSPSMREALLELIGMDLVRERRATRYDLVNHITAAARDTREPETKWRLEELGGAVAAGIDFTRRPPQGIAPCRAIAAAG